MIYLYLRYKKHTDATKNNAMILSLPVSLDAAHNFKTLKFRAMHI